MRPFRRSNLFLAPLCVALCAASGSAVAQSWPAKPVHLVVTTAAGGGTDIIARSYSTKLADALGQPVVIDNKPSAGGILALQTVATSEPDGYMLLASAGGNIAVSPLLYARVAKVAKDLVAIAPTAQTKMLLVANAALPVHSVGELVAYAKANPNKLNYGSPGVGTLPHLAAEMMLHAARVQATHVPYKDSGQTLITGLVRGEISFVFDSGVAIPQIKAGKLRLLAVAAPTRAPAFPDVPTMAQAGLDVDGSIPHGVYAPVGTPKAVIERLHREITQAMHSPEAAAVLRGIGAEPVFSDSPEAFAEQMRRSNARFAGVVKEANVHVE